MGVNYGAGSPECEGKDRTREREWQQQPLVGTHCLNSPAVGWLPQSRKWGSRPSNG